MEINMEDYALRSSFNLLLIALKETNNKLRKYFYCVEDLVNGSSYDFPNEDETWEIIQNNNHILLTFTPKNTTPALSLEA